MAAPDWCVSGASGALLRKGASLGTDAVGELARGTPVLLLAEATVDSKARCLVRTLGTPATTGWCSKSVLRNAPPPPPRDPTVENYAGRAKAFADWAEDGGNARAAAGLRARLLAALSSASSERKYVLLDVGCGSGRDVAAFRDLGHACGGIDPCEELVAIAERKRLPVRVAAADGGEAALPLPEGIAAPLDGIFCCASLFHVPAARLPRTLARFRRSLRSGGALLTTLPLSTSDGRGADGRWHTGLALEAHAALIAAAGFDVVDAATARGLYSGDWGVVVARRREIAVDAAAVAAIRAYHAHTKHAPRRRGPLGGSMDWDAQPDKFRRYSKCSGSVELPPFDAAGGPRYDAGRASKPMPADARNLGAFLGDAFGLSCEKVAGASRWSLRACPSGGALYPVEAYVLRADTATVEHYDVRGHALRTLCSLDGAAAAELRGAAPWSDGGFGVLLTTCLWRTVWKYGEPGYRYAAGQDVGHAVGALAYAAAARGWRVDVAPSVDDAAVSTLSGIFRQAGVEAETPALFAAVTLDGSSMPPPCTIPDAVAAFCAAERAVWSGEPNDLSPRGSHETRCLPTVDAATAAAARTAPAVGAPAPRPAPASGIDRGPRLRRLIADRRSATDLDPVAPPLDRGAFRAFLEVLAAPVAALPWAPAVACLFCVQRVAGVAPGLYVLQRVEDVGAFRAWCGASLTWERLFDGVDCFRVAAADAAAAARAGAYASGGQGLGGNGFFSIAFLADMTVLDVEGAWAYRRLHWECGALAQAAYLDVGRRGFGGCAMGYFFGDETAELLGAEAGDWECLLWFGAGRPVEDPRIRTLPPPGRLAGLGT